MDWWVYLIIGVCVLVVSVIICMIIIGVCVNDDSIDCSKDYPRKEFKNILDYYDDKYQTDLKDLQYVHAKEIIQSLIKEVENDLVETEKEIKRAEKAVPKYERYAREVETEIDELLMRKGRIERDIRTQRQHYGQFGMQQFYNNPYEERFLEVINMKVNMKRTESMNVRRVGIPNVRKYIASIRHREISLKELLCLRYSNICNCLLELNRERVDESNEWKIEAEKYIDEAEKYKDTSFLSQRFFLHHKALVFSAIHQDYDQAIKCMEGITKVIHKQGKKNSHGELGSFTDQQQKINLEGFKFAKEELKLGKIYRIFSTHTSFSMKDFKIIRRLGQKEGKESQNSIISQYKGAEGMIFEVEFLKQSIERTFALKLVVNMVNDPFITMEKAKEANLWKFSDLSHPNLFKEYAYFSVPWNDLCLVGELKIHLDNYECNYPKDVLAIVYPLADGDLKSYQIPKTVYDEDIKRLLNIDKSGWNEHVKYFSKGIGLFKLLSGVDVLYKKCIVHQDIKEENILMENGHLMIGDFGVSFCSSKYQCLEGDKFALINDGSVPRGGSSYFHPPELLYSEIKELNGGKELEYLKFGKCDVFSVGMIAYRWFIDDWEAKPFKVGILPGKRMILKNYAYQEWIKTIFLYQMKYLLNIEI